MSYLGMLLRNLKFLYLLIWFLEHIRYKCFTLLLGLKKIVSTKYLLRLINDNNRTVLTVLKRTIFTAYISDFSWSLDNYFKNELI